MRPTSGSRDSLRSRIRQTQERGNESDASSQSGAYKSTYRRARQSGALNLSSRELKNIPGDLFQIYVLLDPDERSWQSQPLQKLDLSYNELAQLPDELSMFPTLTSLKIRNNRLKEISTGLFDLVMLQSLDLSNNNLDGCVPENIGRLIHLRELNLSHNQFKQLADSICDLSDLQQLFLENNQLDSLPETIGSLEKIQLFSASFNNIRALPESFCRLVQIHTLDVKGNALASIRSNMFEQFDSLRYLDLRQNKLAHLPVLPKQVQQAFVGYNNITEISANVLQHAKESLTVLDLRDNSLVSLPEEIINLRELKTLDLCNNNLHNIPAGLGYLDNLHHLAVDGNPLKSIRRSVLSAGIGALKKYLRTRCVPLSDLKSPGCLKPDDCAAQQNSLATSAFDVLTMEKNEYLFRDAAASGSLQLIDKQLENIPDCVAQFDRYSYSTKLHRLDLSKNPLVSVPSAISHLSALQSLKMEGCNLQSLDTSIALLQQLQHLLLRKNKLTSKSLSDFFLAAGKDVRLPLKELDVRNNQLDELPVELTVCHELDTLLVSYNRLKTLGNGFPWKRMQKLTIISAANNQLTSLGLVHEAPMLTSLAVENNNLTQIPTELSLCQNLTALYITGNPQRSIRMSIVNEGTEAVLRYLRNICPRTSAAKNSSIRSSNQDIEDMSTPDTSKNDASTYASSDSFMQRYHNFKDIFSHENTASASSSGATIFNPSLGTLASVSLTNVDIQAIDLEATIKHLEQRLEDDYSMTSAKRYAIKKELAMARSQKIRADRKGLDTLR